MSAMFSQSLKSCVSADDGNNRDPSKITFHSHATLMARLRFLLFRVGPVYVDAVPHQLHFPFIMMNICYVAPIHLPQFYSQEAPLS